MKRRAQMLLFMLLLAACFAAAQVPRSHHDPAPAHRPGQEKNFIDWESSRINPRNIDYGAQIEELRQSVLDDTLRDPDFRSKALLITALCGLFIAYWWECRTTGGLRVSTTRIITACHSELAVARDLIIKLTGEYGQAKRILDEQMETVLRTKSQRTKLSNTTASGDGPKGNAPDASNDKPSESKLEGQDSVLNQQLLEANQTISSLRRQLGIVSRKYEEEQQKNRKLRGE